MNNQRIQVIPKPFWERDKTRRIWTASVYVSTADPEPEDHEVQAEIVAYLEKNLQGEAVKPEEWEGFQVERRDLPDGEDRPLQESWVARWRAPLTFDSGLKFSKPNPP